MSASAKPRVAIVEPSPVVREGLRTLLEENAAFRIAAMHADLAEFQSRQVGARAAFDILLVNPAVVSVCKKFAPRSLLPPHSNALVAAINYACLAPEVLEGFGCVIDLYDDAPRIAHKLRQAALALEGRDEEAKGGIELSEREKEILTAVAGGLSNKEIADQHCISVHTVVSHRKNITRKTGIHTVAGLTLYAVFNNLIAQDALPH